MDIENKINLLENKISEVETFKNIRENQFLLFIGCSFISLLMSAFILTLTGIIDLKIVNEIQVSPLIEFIGCFLMFMVNIFFVFSITLRIFDKRIMWILFGYSLIWLATYKLSMNIYTSIIFPYVYFVFISCVIFRNIKKAILYSIIYFMFWIIICIFYQPISGYIKLNFSLFDLLYFPEINLISRFLYSIDLYLLYIWIYKGVKNNVSVVLGIPSQKFNIQKDRRDYRQDIFKQSLTDIKSLLKIFVRVSYLIFQLFIVLSIGKLNNVLFEALIMSIIFFIGRSILKKCWHSDTLMWCSIATFTAFYILTKITLPLSISLFMSTVLSACFTYFMYQLGIQQEQFDDITDYLQKFNTPQPFNINTVTEEQMRNRCRKLALSKECEDFCVMAFVWKLRRKEISDKTGYPLSTVKAYITKYKKKLMS